MRLLELGAVLVGALTAAGCTHVAAMAHEQGGGVWYAQESSVLGITGSPTIFYCSPPTEGKPAVCSEATQGATGSSHVSATPARPRDPNVPPCKQDNYCPTGYCKGDACTPS